MPTKLGKGGTGLQNYVPQGDLAGGQYADDATGSNNYFHSALATMLGKQDQHLPYNRSAVSQLVADQNKRNIKPLVKRELVEKIEPKKEIINDKNEIIEKIEPKEQYNQEEIEKMRQGLKDHIFGSKNYSKDNKVFISESIDNMNEVGVLCTNELYKNFNIWYNIRSNQRGRAFFSGKVNLGTDFYADKLSNLGSFRHENGHQIDKMKEFGNYISYRYLKPLEMDGETKPRSICYFAKKELEIPNDIEYHSDKRKETSERIIKLVENKIEEHFDKRWGKGEYKKSTQRFGLKHAELFDEYFYKTQLEIREVRDKIVKKYKEKNGGDLFFVNERLRKNYQDELEKSRTDIETKYNRLRDEEIAKLEGISDYEEKRKDIKQYAFVKALVGDTYSGWSFDVNGLGWGGHERSYWQERPDVKNTELFAECFACISNKNQNSWEVAKEIMPKTCQMFEEMLKIKIGKELKI